MKHNVPRPSVRFQRDVDLWYVTVKSRCDGSPQLSVRVDESAFSVAQLASCGVLLRPTRCKQRNTHLCFFDFMKSFVAMEATVPICTASKTVHSHKYFLEALDWCIAQRTVLRGCQK